MDRFHIIEDAAAIIVTRSVFKQVKLYHRGNALYVGASGGFVRLYKGGRTGVPNLSWDDIEIPGVSRDDLASDGMEKLSLPGPIKTIEGGK